jgi:hypothetical protein
VKGVGPVPAKFDVLRSELLIEAGYPNPQFGLFRDQDGLLGRLLAQLAQYGLTLAGMKLERGTGTLGELHLLFYLLDYSVTVRIRVDRVEIQCSQLTEENKKRVIAASLATLNCIRENVKDGYSAYAVSMSIHGMLEKQDVRSFLRGLVVAPPAEAGPIAGSAVAYYFSPADERIASSLTFDVSALIADGLYVRPQATWDARRLPLNVLAERAEDFVRNSLGAFGIELPQ